VPHLGAEDFVTAALAQIAPCGELTIVNCDRHPPLLSHLGELQPLTDSKAALPLGLEDGFTASTAAWSAGARLLPYTDGLVESRDAHGHFLPEDAIETALLAPGCDQALDTLMRAVDRHTGGHAHDDTACAMRPGQRSRKTTEPLLRHLKRDGVNQVVRSWRGARLWGRLVRWPP
jgi:phosphoserine phosphatase RsbU/P